MKKFILKTSAGNTFDSVSKEAKDLTDKHELVEFKFNEVICLVNKDTNLNWLYRDYSNSWTMGWKQVGPDCLENYEPEVQKEFEEKTAIRQEESRKRQEQYDKEEKEQREACEEKTKGIELEIIVDKISEYKTYVENNSQDGYSRAVIDYGEAWGKMMQIEIAKGRSVKEVADECQKGLGFLGITGFQYGCAVKGLAHFWKHGEDLRKWHNKVYGVSEDKKGVVNPAILTISS